MEVAVGSPRGYEVEYLAEFMLLSRLWAGMEA